MKTNLISTGSVFQWILNPLLDLKIKQNPDISFNCSISESETELKIYPKYFIKTKGMKQHVNLLHISNGPN